MARQLLAKENQLLCISRSSSENLASAAQLAGCSLVQWPQDLANPLPVADSLREWLAAIDPLHHASATLINNAGVIPAIAPLSASDPAELGRALRVGLEAPLLLASAFLAATERWSADRKVLNISSGLGRRPMASQAAYCAAKAGMDHFTRCLALDEANKSYGARVCSLAPGVIDTDMQVQLRSAIASDFPDQANFLKLKQAGQLTSVDDAAARVLAYLSRSDFGSQPIADVRD